MYSLFCHEVAVVVRVRGGTLWRETARVSVQVKVRLRPVDSLGGVPRRSDGVQSPPVRCRKATYLFRGGAEPRCFKNPVMLNRD